MKDWKEELLQALEEEAKELKTIKFYDVAKAKGYKHINRQDVSDIFVKFCKLHPEYEPVYLLDYKGQPKSLFTNGALTMNEWEDEEDFLRENEVL